MTSSCPYCGAALKLNFCLVCGRQSQVNKMGNIRPPARNPDTTHRLDEPFRTEEEENDPQKSLRFRTDIGTIIKNSISWLIAGALILCVVMVAWNFCNVNNINNVIVPWMKCHHLPFLYNVPSKLTKHQNALQNAKKQRNRNKF